MERRQAYGRQAGMWKAGKGSQSQTDAEFMSHNRHQQKKGRTGEETRAGGVGTRKAELVHETRAGGGVVPSTDKASRELSRLSCHSYLTSTSHRLDLI